MFRISLCAYLWSNLSLRGDEATLLLVVKLNNKKRDISVDRYNSVKFISPVLHSWIWAGASFFLHENRSLAYLFVSFRLSDRKKYPGNISCSYPGNLQKCLCPSVYLNCLEFWLYWRFVIFTTHILWCIEYFHVRGWGTVYADAHHIAPTGEFSTIEENVQSLVFLSGIK